MEIDFKIKVLIFWSCLIAVIIIGMWGVLNIRTGEFTEIIPIVINVSEERQIGVHMTEDEKILNFGAIFPGSKVKRIMNLERGNEPPAQVHIFIDGNIKNWTSFDKDNFILDNPTDVNIVVTVPDAAEKGMYSGNVTINYVSTYITIFEKALRI